MSRSADYNYRTNVPQMVTALESIGDAVIITDLSGRITFMNNMAVSLTGWFPGEGLRKDFREVFYLINAETGQVLESPWMQALKSGSAIGLQQDSMLLARNGARRYVSASISPIKNRAGNINGIIVVFRDITRIKTLELERHREEENFKTIFASAPVGMLILGEDLLINQVNNEALGFLGFSATDVLGKSFGNGFSCKESFENPRGCGFGENCSACELQKAIIKASQTGKTYSNIDFKKSFIFNHSELEFWFTANVTAINVGEKRNLVITLLNITERKHTEEVLQRYQILSERVRDVILFIIPDGRIMEANEAAVRTYGYTREELLSLTIFDLRETGKITEQQLSEAENTGLFFETWHKRKDGSIFPVEVSTQCTKIGGYNLIASIIRDISERRIVECALRESEAKYREFFNAAMDGIYLHEILDDSYLVSKFVEVNDITCARLGYNRTEILQMYTRDISKPLEQDFYDNLIRQVMLKGYHTYENTHITKDGREIPVEVSARYLEMNGRKYILSLARDITERKKAECDILESQTKYQSLFMNMHSAFIYLRTILGEQGELDDLEFVEVNQAYENYFGLKKENILGKRHSEIFPIKHSEFLQLAREAKQSMNQGGCLYLDEYEINDKWFTLSIYSPERNYLACLLHDVTHKMQAEIAMRRAIDAAKEASRSKSEFLANMSHEIRTPLNGMVGMIDLTLLTDLTDEQRDNIYTAKTCAQSLLRIINDILDFSKMEAGKLSIEKVNFDLKALVEDLMKTHSPLASQKGLELSYTLSSNLPHYLLGDPNRLQQILHNLIGNAIKFTVSGEVSLSIKNMQVDSETVELLFAVIDTGIGISENQRDRLFTSFGQLDGSFTKKFGGTGLGLVISKQLVEMMGGEIWLESEKEKGSTFSFILRFQPGLKSAEIKKQPIISTSEHKLRILLAEDDPINQKVLKQMLKEKGHNVEVVSTGKEALDMYEQGKYDVVLMDIQMPVMDGLEATREIRKKETLEHKKTPIIALTAYALKGDRERFLAMGMNDYMAKPVDMLELFTLLDKLGMVGNEQAPPGLDEARVRDSGEIIYVERGSFKLKEEEIAILSEISLCIIELEMFAAAHKLPDLESTAHRIKALANGIDAEELKSAAFRIELAARRGNLREAVELARKIRPEFDTFKKSYS